jgi:hypothetical protein
VVWRGLDAHQRKVLHITGLDTVLFLDGIRDAGARMVKQPVTRQMPAD